MNAITRLFARIRTAFKPGCAARASGASNAAQGETRIDAPDYSQRSVANAAFRAAVCRPRN